MSGWIKFSSRGGPRHREGDRLPASDAATPEQRARELAHQEVVRSGRPWLEPIGSELIFHEGRPCWFVVTNWQNVGASVEVVIDDRSAKVVRVIVRPR